MRYFFILAMVLCGSGVALAAPMDDADAAYTNQDYATALKIVQPLAESGMPRAQNLLGLMYDVGRGVPQNAETAVTWYRRAAEQGYADAQNNLALMYLIGSGVPASPTEAVKWFRTGALLGNDFAQANLGMMHENGNGTPKDMVKAYIYYSLLTAQGKAKADRFKDENARRDTVAKKMTPEQIRQAQNLVNACIDSKYKTCE